MRVTKVVNLPMKEDGTVVDGYVHLYITPDHPPGRQNRFSGNQRRSVPYFEEELTFYEMSKEELLNATLHIEVLDYHSYGKHTLLCQNELLLHQVQFIDGSSIVTLQLLPPNVRCMVYYGVLTFLLLLGEDGVQGCGCCCLCATILIITN